MAKCNQLTRLPFKWLNNVGHTLPNVSEYTIAITVRVVICQSRNLASLQYAMLSLMVQRQAYILPVHLDSSGVGLCERLVWQCADTRLGVLET